MVARHHLTEAMVDSWDDAQIDDAVRHKDRMAAPYESLGQWERLAAMKWRLAGLESHLDPTVEFPHSGSRLARPLFKYLARWPANPEDWSTKKITTFVNLIERTRAEVAALRAACERERPQPAEFASRLEQAETTLPTHMLEVVASRLHEHYMHYRLHDRPQATKRGTRSEKARLRGAYAKDKRACVLP